MPRWLSVQWFRQEVGRPYVLHKARAVHEASVTRERMPEAPLPVYLRGRGEAGEPLPALEVVSPSAEGAQAGGAEAVGERGGGAETRARKRGRKAALAEEGDGVSEEERAATLSFVLEDLSTELYVELQAGLKLRGHRLLDHEDDEEGGGGDEHDGSGAEDGGEDDEEEEDEEQREASRQAYFERFDGEGDDEDYVAAPDHEDPDDFSDDDDDDGDDSD